VKAKILIVDDDDKNVVLLTIKMKREGYEVASANNGMDALERVRTFMPDVILMDVMMPRMNGYEVLKALKDDESTRYIPVIMLTGLGGVENKVQGFDVGAEDYITKPFSLREVSARVRSLLRVRALQKRIRDTEKMAALGGMVDGIAHEIRNPLMVIGGMARRLHDRDIDEKSRGYAEAIIKCVERLEKMIVRVDDYKRILVSKLKAIEINRVVEDAVSDMAFLIEGRDIEIKISCLKPSPVVNMDYINLKTALCNIIENSVEAMGDRGVIELSTRLEDGRVVVQIKDNGHGIDPDEQKKIFHPFQTSRIEGAGLGLTMAHRIVSDHNGEISVSSEPDVGTVITITLDTVRSEGESSDNESGAETS